MERHQFSLRWTCRVIAVFAVVLLCLAHPAQAGFPPEPVLEGLSKLINPPQNRTGHTLGRVELAVGDVRLISPEGLYSVPEMGVDLFQGDTLVSGTTGRFRLLLQGGDVIQVGKESLISLQQDEQKGNQSWRATVWRGAIIFYTFPSLRGGTTTQTVHFPKGVLQITTGKTGLLAQPSTGKYQLSALKQAVTWRDEQGNKHRLSSGKTVSIDSAGYKETRFPKGFEKQFTMQTSLEGPLVAAGLKLYESKAYDQTITTLTHVQRSFPYNSLVAYYLGLAHLAKEDLRSTVQQWRLYEKIDPKGALKNETSKHLTVLMSKRMKEEVREILAQEKALSQSEPEPNSVAIPPFANRGDAKFNVMAKGITAMIIADLSKVPGIKVLERAKMQHLVNEIKLSQSGLVSEKTKVRAGRIMKAEKLIIGDFTAK